MPPPSIQAFFSSSPSKAGDGFTEEEVDVVLRPPSIANTWTPTVEYEEADLGNLTPGPKNLSLMGRIVNFYDVSKPSKRPKSAQGYYRIMLADNTGVITVRLWYAATEYTLRLGQLVSLWTVHISYSSDHISLAPNSAPLFTTIFPEGERHCHFMTHDHSDNGTQCKRPFNCKNSQTIPGLMTLKSFTDGGYDIDECKLLVCVKSIGARKNFTNKNGMTSNLCTLGIFDHTTEGLLTLYGSACNSITDWKPSITVLLITNPSWRIDRLAKLSLNGNSRVDIDPDLADARWLRALAQRMTKIEHVNPPFPEGVFDTHAAEHGALRVLYNLADIDEFARNNPNEKVTGYLSIIITQLNIVTNFKRNMLMSNQCCGIPTYANSVIAKCKQCEENITLRINPRILGNIIDETGQISSGKIILSEKAWEQLLGRTADQLVKTDLEVLQYLEQRLLFLRVTLGFGLAVEDEVGRLAIWAVKM